jgi:hypothetical protein
MWLLPFIRHWNWRLQQYQQHQQHQHQLNPHHLLQQQQQQQLLQHRDLLMLSEETLRIQQGQWSKYMYIAPGNSILRAFNGNKKQQRIALILVSD